MSKKKAVWMAAAILTGSVSLVTGCVPTQQTAIERGPDLEVKEGIELDETQLYNDVLEAFGDTDNNPYVYISAFDIACDNDKKAITVTASCIDETTEEEAKQFAAAAVRRINDAAVIQSSEYQLSSQKDFGDLWKSYELKLTVRPQSAAEGDDSRDLIDLDIPAGEKIPLDPDIETYEETWQEQRDEILQNRVYDVSGNVVE